SANTFNEFEFDLGERITKLSLWGNDAGTRLGAVMFTTSENRQFFEKMTSWGLKTEYTIDVGSGICLGLQGRYGSDINSMGFLFINTIKSSVLTDMEYPTLSLFKPQVSSSIDVCRRKTLTKTSSWSVSNKIESTLNVSVKAGIPDLVEVSSGFSLTVGVEQSTSLEKTETITESDTINVKIPPGRTLDVEITVGKANMDLDYRATVKVTCMNGSQLVFPSNGTYTGVTYTSARVSTKER
uniref:Jacalin-type lectin domain-containing protein n=1 Tax=Salmo trutta TaxID=8032 RepID=A0A674D0P6_SALTR